MMVSVYNNITHTSDPAYHDVFTVLEWIKVKRIEKKIVALRKITDKEANRNYKNTLPSIVFAGKFTEREDDFCEELSGLAILDFDHLKDPEDKKLELSALPYILAAFISPNGDGIKALAKIPKQYGRFAGYYRGLQKHHPELDPKNKNISRVCFLSSDDNIYINTEATEFTEYIAEPKNADRQIQANAISIDDSNVIVKNLFKWWTGKYQMTAGNRNHNIFVLASALNEYGIEIEEAKSLCCQYSQEDFTEGEIITTVKSAYKKTNLHNTKQFTISEKFTNYTPLETPTQEAKVESIFGKMFNASFIDVTKKIDYPPVAISIGQHKTGSQTYPTAFGTFGNFSAIVGASKSKKTFFKSLLVASYIGGNSDRYSGNISGHRKQGELVIDIDTEQGEWHAQSVFKRIPRMVGENPDFYKPFALRKYSHLERIQFIEYLIYESEYKDNIGLFVIDGLADLVADFNDLKETNLIIQKVMKWTGDKNFHLITIIHQNSTTNKATGHLGSSILKKAETVCNLVNSNDIVEVTFPYTRGFPIENIQFEVNSEGLPEMLGNKPKFVRNYSEPIEPEDTTPF